MLFGEMGRAYKALLRDDALEKTPVPSLLPWLRRGFAAKAPGPRPRMPYRK